MERYPARPGLQGDGERPGRRPITAMETDRRPPSSLIPPPPLFNAGVEHSYASTEAAASRGSSSADASSIADPDRCESQRGSRVASPSLEVDVFADAPDDVSLQETKAAAVDLPDLSEELRDRIVRQVEYFFSEENLATDRFLLRFIKKDKEGYVPIEVIASFRKTKKLTKTLCVIEAALRTSSQLVVSEDGKKVKRLHQLSIETTDSKLRTVIVDNLPDDCSEKNIRSIFGKLGKILKITLHNPHLHHKPANNRKSGIVINSKTQALIEYGTVEAAASAVGYFNHEDNWRSGMCVELQLTRMGKHGLALKGLKTTYEKNSSARVEEPNANREKISIVNHEMLALKEEGKQGKGVPRNRYRGRGRGRIKQNLCNDARAQQFQQNGHAFANKPVQRPRMPDGTRGFAFGRGKPEAKST